MSGLPPTIGIGRRLNSQTVPGFTEFRPSVAAESSASISRIPIVMLSDTDFHGTQRTDPHLRILTNTIQETGCGRMRIGNRTALDAIPIDLASTLPQTLATKGGLQNLIRFLYAL